MVAKAKLTDADRDAIRARKAANPTVSNAELAREFDVHPSQISRLVTARENAPTTVTSENLFRLADIHPSPLNPRKTFDEEALEQLAASIKAQGLLQNLVIRAAAEGSYQIVAGERRYRALTLLADRGEWDRDAASVSARLVDANDGEHLAIALLENLQRKDVNPMEEAEAFAQLQELDPEKWSPRGISEAIGMTVRHVQLRIALVNKLSEDSRSLLRDGRMSLAHARVLTILPHDRQKTFHDQLDRLSPADLKSRISWTLIPVARAAFSLDVFKGDVVEDEEGNKFFAVEKQFKKAQLDEAKRRAALQKDAGWDFIEAIAQWSGKPGWEYEPAPKGKIGGYLVIVDQDGKGEISEHSGYVKKQKTESNNDQWRIKHLAEERLEAEMNEAAAPFISAMAERLSHDTRAALQLVMFTMLAKRAHWNDKSAPIDLDLGLHPEEFAEGQPLSFMAEFMAQPAPHRDNQCAVSEKADLAQIWSIMGDHLHDTSFAAAVASRIIIRQTPLTPPLVDLAKRWEIPVPATLMMTASASEGRMKQLMNEIQAEQKSGSGTKSAAE